MISELKENDVVYLNGNWLPFYDAKISPLDRGFLFADGVYEVIPVYNCVPFLVDDHIARLFQSLIKIKIKIALSKDELISIIQKLIGQSKFKNQIIYIQITRGVAPRNHAFPVKKTLPTIFAMSTLLNRPSDLDKSVGIKAITLDDNRWARCNIKSIALLPNVLSRQEAVSSGVDEAILFKNNLLTEGAASTIWVVKNSKVYCPKKSSLLLEGIRISLIKNICKDLEINFQRRNLIREELINADEVLLTSATKEVASVVEIDNIKIGLNNYKGSPGPIFKLISDQYNKVIKNNLNIA